MDNVRKIGRYEVKGRLGRGGMAEVFSAYDPALNRQVAIKVLPRQLTFQTELRQRFEYEVKTIGSLRHDAIVPVYDVGEHEGQPYLVMPHMAGGSLRQRLGHLTNQEIATIFTRLADAVDKAHEKGIIHRDIKPDNVLLDESGKAYLADFGIARALEATAPFTAGVGTAAYMSPEQVKGEALDGRSDIYALGVTLFELWTGEPPYQAANANTVQYKHVQDPIPNILQRNPKLPRACRAIMNKAMAKQPKDRYATAGELAKAITAVAYPPPPKKADPPQKSILERPLWQWVAAIIALLAGVAGFCNDSFGVIDRISSNPTATNVPALSENGTEPLTPTPEPPTPETAITLGATRVRPADGMVLRGVPGGTFMMGSDPAQDPQAQDNEQPQHPVTLDDYWIDQTEVTNAMYGKCVAAGNCDASSNADDSTYNGADFPVVGVSWYDADAYCRWAGGRLPTEAEWEYAARGDTRRIYPWDGSFDASRLNARGTGDGYERTAPVGSFSPVGDSWVEAQDMAGNVWEWVYDWYSDYDDSAKTNPSGPESGDFKVLRGGSWSSDAIYNRAANRNGYVPDSRNATFGFRCVLPPGQ